MNFPSVFYSEVDFQFCFQKAFMSPSQFAVTNDAVTMDFIANFLPVEQSSNVLKENQQLMSSEGTIYKNAR